MAAIVRRNIFDQPRLALIRFRRSSRASAGRKFMEPHMLETCVEEKFGAVVGHNNE
jgi:hypothetical protein